MSQNKAVTKNLNRPDLSELQPKAAAMIRVTSSGSSGSSAGVRDISRNRMWVFRKSSEVRTRLSSKELKSRRTVLRSSFNLRLLVRRPSSFRLTSASEAAAADEGRWPVSVRDSNLRFRFWTGSRCLAALGVEASSGRKGRTCSSNSASSRRCFRRRPRPSRKEMTKIYDLLESNN